MEPLRTLDALDEAFLAAQDRILDAVEDTDTDLARELKQESSGYTVDDADGNSWSIAVPDADSILPLFKFRYRYRRRPAGSDERGWIRSRGRFVSDPALAEELAVKVGERQLLRPVVRNAEPIGYGAGAAVLVGLWVLLGDAISRLSPYVALGFLVAAAAGLWFSSFRLEAIEFREARRVAFLTRVAAILVTAGIPWLATTETNVSGEWRTALTSSVLFGAAAWSFTRQREGPSFGIALGAWIVLIPSLFVGIATELMSDPIEGQWAQVGALVAVALAFPIVTRTASLRWTPIACAALTATGSIAVLVSLRQEAKSAEAAVALLLGAATALVAWASGRWMHKRLRAAHRGSWIVLASATAFLALAKGPWDLIVDLLEEVSLPVILVVAGSVVLAGLGFAIRTAVRHIGEGDEPR